MNMKKDAILSSDRQYRYMLSRVWDENLPMVVFIGLNPSTADETTDDNTIKKCIKFATSWGYGGLYMLNLFAYRSTNPYEMYNVADPVGSKNNGYIQEYAKKSDKVICAWGNMGSYNGRSSNILKQLDNAYYIKLNKTGEPSHPLYKNADLKPQKIKH